MSQDVWNLEQLLCDCNNCDLYSTSFSLTRSLRATTNEVQLWPLCLFVCLFFILLSLVELFFLIFG